MKKITKDNVKVTDSTERVTRKYSDEVLSRYFKTPPEHIALSDICRSYNRPHGSKKTDVLLKQIFRCIASRKVALTIEGLGLDDVVD